MLIDLMSFRSAVRRVLLIHINRQDYRATVNALLIISSRHPDPDRLLIMENVVKQLLPNNPEVLDRWHKLMMLS